MRDPILKLFYLLGIAQSMVPSSSCVPIIMEVLIRGKHLVSYRMFLADFMNRMSFITKCIICVRIDSLVLFYSKAYCVVF